MKVTRENGGNGADRENVNKTVCVCWECLDYNYSNDTGTFPRVLEYPKYWREKGVQYKVDSCALVAAQFYSALKKIKIIRIPEGAEFWYEDEVRNAGVVIEYY